MEGKHINVRESPWGNNEWTEIPENYGLLVFLSLSTIFELNRGYRIYLASAWKSIGLRSHVRLQRPKPLEYHISLTERRKFSMGFTGHNTITILWFHFSITLLHSIFSPHVHVVTYPSICGWMNRFVKLNKIMLQ
jgi:hypothetical protein